MKTIINYIIKIAKKHNVPVDQVQPRYNVIENRLEFWQYIQAENNKNEVWILLESHKI